MATSFDELINSLHNNAIIADEVADDKIILINDKRQFIPGSAFNTEIAFEGDINSQVITFKCIRRSDSHDLSLCQYKQLKWKNIQSNIDGISKLIVVNGNPSEEFFYVKWELPPEICTLASTIEISIQFFDKDEDSGLIAYSWNTGLYRALSIGKSLSSVDFDFPARDEILIIDRETRNIVAPVGYNNVVCNYGDIGVARVAFLTERYVGIRKDLDVLATNVDIILFVQSGEWSTSYSLSDKKLYTAEISDRNKEGLVYFEWFPEEEFTTSDKLIGKFDVSIQFRNGEKTWNSNTYSNLKIAETTIMMNSGEEADPVPASSVVDIINRQLLNEYGELKEEYIPYSLENSVNILNEDMPIYKNKTDVLEKKVSNLEARLDQDYFITDETTAYEKIVPDQVCPYAQINKIGGNTRSCINLLSYPYYHTTKNHKGIKFTDNGDGSITINGMNDGTSMSSFYLSHFNNKPLHLKAGTYTIFDTGNSNITISISDKNGTCYKDTFSLSVDTDVQVCIRIPTGNTTNFNNVTVYPMLNRGSTALPWEQYFEGLRDAKVTKLISKSYQLINPNDLIAKATFMGARAESNENGEIVINGKNILAGWINISRSFKLSKGIYTFSIAEDLTNISLGIGLSGSDYGVFIGKLSNENHTLTFELAKDSILYLAMSLKTEITYTNVVIRPMINEGTMALPFSKYKAEDSVFEIPEEIQALRGYGQSYIDSNYEYDYNYIDFEREVFVYRGYVSNDEWVYDYKEIDISEYLTETNFIEVVNGCSIIAINEYSRKAPTSITYLLKEGSI